MNDPRNGEQTALLIPSTTAADNTPENAVEVGQATLDSGVVIKVLSNGANYFLQAINTIGNSIIFKIAGFGAAASLCSSFQFFARNVFSGMLGASGQQLSGARGENNAKELREIVIVSYAMTALLTLISTIAYLAAYFAFPKAYAEDTSTAACDYVKWTAFGIWPTLALTTLSQIAFAFDYWKLSLFSSLMNRVPAVALSYFLTVDTRLKVSGIGVGNLIAPWITYIAMEIGMRNTNAFNNAFVTRDDHVLDYAQLWEKFKTMFFLCLKFGFQRCTEWLNLLIVTLLIGASGNTHLEIINPSLNAIGLWGLFSQGIGMGANQLLMKLKGNLKKQLDGNAPVEEIQKTLNDIKGYANKSLLSGIIINLVVAIIMFFLRHQITNLFVDSASEQAQKDTEKVLWITALGLVADAPRIISASMLNPWNKIILPNAISLILMTGIGIGLNYGVAKGKDANYADISMFAIRSIMIFIAAAINTFMLYSTINEEKTQIYRRLNIISHEEENNQQCSYLFSLFQSRQPTAVAVAPSSVNEQTGYRR